MPLMTNIRSGVIISDDPMHNHYSDSFMVICDNNEGYRWVYIRTGECKLEETTVDDLTEVFKFHKYIYKDLEEFMNARENGDACNSRFAMSTWRARFVSDTRGDTRGNVNKEGW